MHLEEDVQARVVLESLLLRDHLSSQEGRLHEEAMGSFSHWLWRTDIRQGVPNHNWYSYKITYTSKAQRTSGVGTGSW